MQASQPPFYPRDTVLCVLVLTQSFLRVYGLSMARCSIQFNEVRRIGLWNKMKLSWRVITIYEGKAVKPERMALATVCSHLCGWLIRAWVRVTAILTRLRCRPSFQKLSKPAWTVKSLCEGRGYGSLPIRRCDFYKICSLTRKKGLSTEQTKTSTQCILKIMTLSEAQSKRLKILILVYYYATDYILKARNKKKNELKSCLILITTRV